MVCNVTRAVAMASGQWVQNPKMTGADSQKAEMIQQLAAYYQAKAHPSRSLLITNSLAMCYVVMPLVAKVK